MKTNFTPGPWTMDSIDTPLQLAYGDVIGGDDSGNRDICANDGEILIAVLYGDGILPQTANAHLIAAAPEMYEALYEIIPVVSHLLGEVCASDMEYERDDARFVQPLRELLAKARGEE